MEAIGRKKDALRSGQIGGRITEHIIVLLLVFFSLLMVLRGELSSGGDLFFKAFRDINPIIFWYPVSRLELLSWSQGLFPLWNPYSLLGTPILGGYQSAVFSPLLWP